MYKVKILGVGREALIEAYKDKLLQGDFIYVGIKKYMPRVGTWRNGIVLVEVNPLTNKQSKPLKKRFLTDILSNEPWSCEFDSNRLKRK